jgi:hypothetical protein
LSCSAGEVWFALAYPCLFTTIFKIWGPCDGFFIHNYITQNRIGFSDVQILRHEGDASVDNPRTLIFQVTIDDGAKQMTCQGKIWHTIGDPGFSFLTFPDAGCERQFVLVGGANCFLEERQQPSVWGPLEEQDLKYAPVLKVWINRGWIKLTDIQKPDLRSEVESSLNENLAT